MTANSRLPVTQHFAFACARHSPDIGLHSAIKDRMKFVDSLLQVLGVTYLRRFIWGTV